MRAMVTRVVGANLLAAFAPFAAIAATPVTSQAVTAASVRVPPYERIVLENGLTLVVMPRREIPLVAFNAVLRGGGASDPRGKAGIASIAAALLEKGAGTRDAFAFADAVEGAGGRFSPGAGAEAITVSGEFLAQNRDLMIELLADALQRPHLSATEFETLRARHIEFIRAAKDSDPSELLGRYGRALLFGEHPFGAPLSGSEQSLAAITHEDIVRCARDNFGPERTTIVLSGDLDAAWARGAVIRAFGDWKRGPAPAPAIAPASRVQGRRVLLVDAPGSVQTYFWIGNVGVAKKYPRRAALEVVNTVFGGRFTSILNTKLRIESGLTYGAGSAFVRATVPGEFSIRSFTQTETTGKALDLALATLDQLHAQGIPAAALASGRDYVIGQYPTRFETAGHWAAALGELEFYGLDRSWIEGYGAALAQVSADDARAVIADAFPSAGNVAIVLIGDAAKIRDVAAKLGPVTEMPFTAPRFQP